MVSSAFYLHEIEAEMRERKLDWVFKGKLDDACDDFMTYIESQRRIENYTHPTASCSQMCRERGKIIFPILYNYKHLLLPLPHTYRSGQNNNHCNNCFPSPSPIKKICGPEKLHK